jgi:methyl-accepting chemotaxis protein
LSLRNKIAVTMAAVLAAVLVGVVANNIRLASRSTRAAVLETADALATVFAANCTSAIVTDDMAALQEYAQRLSRGRIAGVSVVNGDGLILADSDPARLGAKWRRAGAAEGDLYEASAVIRAYGGDWGHAHIRYSLDSLREALEEMGRQSLLAGIVALGLMFAATLGIARTLTRPLASLVDSAKAVATGNLAHEIRAGSRDELGTLAATFEQMRAGLREAIGGVKDMIGVTTSASLQTKQVVAVLRADADAQATAVRTTLGLVGEIDESIRDSTRAADELSRLSTDSATSVQVLDRGLKDLFSDASDLARAVESTSTSIREMSTAIGQISVSAATLSDGAAASASALSETVASIDSVAHNAATSSTLAGQVRAEAYDRGLVAVREVADGMRAIEGAVEEAATLLAALGARSEQIGVILKVIGEITDQTNLLALNAAIIAAQAGEQGSGFAVVAQEVKALAQRTASSTTEIGTMVDAIRDEVQSCIAAVERGRVHVHDGVRKSSDAQGALQQIVRRAEDASVMARQIEAATQEQRSALQSVDHQIGRSADMMVEIRDSTSETERGAGTISKAAQDVSAVAQRLYARVQKQVEHCNLIRANVEAVAGRSLEISSTAKAQRDKSEAIRSTAHRGKEISVQTVRRFDELITTVADLTKHAERLEEESRKFVL